MTEDVTAAGYTAAPKDMETTVVSLMSQDQQKQCSAGLTYNINTSQQNKCGSDKEYLALSIIW